MHRSYTIEFRDHGNFDIDKTLIIETDDAKKAVMFNIGDEVFTLGPNAARELKVVLNEIVPEES